MNTKNNTNSESSSSNMADHKEKLLQKLKNMQNFKPTDSTQFKMAPNVKIFVGPTKRLFSVHLFVLLMWSESFGKHLMQVDKQSFSDRYEMVIEDVDSVSAFNDFVTYLYSGSVDISMKNSRDLLHVSIKFDLKDLKSKVLEFISDSVDCSTVLSVLPSAIVLSSSEEQLLKKCWQIIEDHTDKVINREEFLTLSQEVVLEIAKRDKLNITEIDLLQGVIAWAHANSKKFYAGMLPSSGAKVNASGANTLSNSPTKQQLQSSPLQKQLQVQQQQEKLSRKVAGGLDREYFEAVVQPIIKEIRFPLMKPNELMGIVKNMNVLDKEYYIMCLEFNAAPQSFDANKKIFKQRKKVDNEKEKDQETSKEIDVVESPKQEINEVKAEIVEKKEPDLVESAPNVSNNETFPSMLKGKEFEI